MARKRATTPAEAFSATLRTALEHFADPAWLGEHSVLATPYFLSRHLSADPTAATVLARGELLQSLIRDSAAELWPGLLPASAGGLRKAADEERLAMGPSSPRYQFLLLEVRYLRRYFGANSRPTTVTAMPDFLNVSSTRFFVHLQQAIDALEKKLLKRIQPSLRLERPKALPHLVGREALLEAILSDLTAGRSVAISGVGGIGKSTLGAAVAARWPPSARFWYTFHPGLNDDLNSVLFSIGHFLNGWGRSSLWLQLLASGGKLENLAQALGFLRADLAQIAPDAPLFCFDEVDSLLTSGQAPRRESHIQLLEFLESLRGEVALLLIGQRALVDTDAHYTLPPLSLSEAEIMLSNAGIALDRQYRQRMHRFTHGNPRLLVLYIALHQSGDDITDVIELSRAPSARPLFNRLWKRLDLKERYVLGVLAAFRSYAPRDAWDAEPQALNSLIERRLVSVDLAGGVVLLPFFRELVWRDLPAEQHDQFHDEAAAIRIRRGQFTEAAYHYWRAGDLDTAVQVWYEHQDGEILRGQAGAAYDIFSAISTRQLRGRPRRQLKTIQNRLYLMTGEADRVLAGMRDFSWHPDEEITAEAYGQWARAAAIVGRSEQAIERHGEAIATLMRVATKVSNQYLQRAKMYIRETDAAGARRQGQLAQYDISSLFGMVEYVLGNFEAAEAHYRAALELAYSFDDSEKIASTNYDLAMLAGRRGQVDEARQHAEAVMVHYEKVGNRVLLESMRAELAGMYLNVREFEKVIEPSEKALAFFEQIGHERWVSSLCNNLAEAYFETGQIDKAKSHVHRVLQLEYARSRPYALYTLSLIHRHEEDQAAAESVLQEGIRVAQENADRFIEAYLQRELGKLYLYREADGRGAQVLETAAQLFEQLGLAREVEETKKL